MYAPRNRSKICEPLCAVPFHAPPARLEVAKRCVPSALYPSWSGISSRGASP